MILGIDEVGRGPWAGPLVIGAVVLGKAKIEGLTDSKKLSKKRRDELDVLIREQADGYGLGWVSSQEIDQIGLSAALRLATIRAVEQVGASYSEIIIDGTINFLKETSKGKYVTTLAKGDLLVPSISAASIIAKVARDNYMAEQDALYPGYGFGSHVGYGTAAHAAAIAALGITPLHRRSFAPIAKIVGVEVAKTTKVIGDEAESVAAEFLERRGHTILERNWKTKFCEVDIISIKNDVVYFTEVKYRKDMKHGGGIGAITTKKLQKMRFAVDVYIVKKSLHSIDLRLAVMTLHNEPPDVIDFLEVE